jgi:NAD(P)-dependent dehydrogenase (short-subunit alcohol dehydrogenase family)
MAVALVTGTSTGIGLSTALALGRAGHTVYATMRTPERTPQLADTATAEGLAITVLKMDVDSDASVDVAFESVWSEQDHLDALVNNAGIGSIGPVEEAPMEVFRQAMETNYFGALRCIKAVLPRMRERRSGCIINVSSVAGRVPVAPQGPYAASKFALEALSEILAQEVKGFNIRVAIVEPGIIATPILEKRPDVPVDSQYPHERRLRAMFLAALANPTSAEVVANQIREIVGGDSWKLRYPVGPDARPLISMRRLTPDEEWIERYGEPDDEVWCRRMQEEFMAGDLRPYFRPPLTPPSAGA